MTLVAVRFIERGLDRLPGIGRSCLYRALGRYAALRAAGLDVELLVGVRSGADLIGHAWVELDGVPLWEREEPRYTVTFRTKGTRS